MTTAGVASLGDHPESDNQPTTSTKIGQSITAIQITLLTLSDRFSDRVAALENFVLVNDVVEVLVIHPMVVNASLSRRRRFSGPRPAPLNLLLLTRLLGVISAGSGQHIKSRKNTDWPLRALHRHHE